MLYDNYRPTFISRQCPKCNSDSKQLMQEVGYMLTCQRWPLPRRWGNLCRYTGGRSTGKNELFSPPHSPLNDYWVLCHPSWCMSSPGPHLYARRMFCYAGCGVDRPSRNAIPRQIRTHAPLSLKA